MMLMVMMSTATAAMMPKKAMIEIRATPPFLRLVRR